MTSTGPFGTSIRDTFITDVETGLAAVESGLFDATRSNLPYLTEAAQHLLRAGGKRFRPMLVLLAGQFGDPHAPGVVPAAMVVELTHLATLYHDDVMDEAHIRRGVDSANARWSNSTAVLTGDFLFARATEIVADLGVEAIRIQAEAFDRLTAGQISETVGPVNGQDPVSHYLQVLAGKTGSLIAASGRIGALMSGADSGVIDTFARYGERLGIAYQLRDDVLDIASDAPESGKTPGTDLREGIPTLPVLLLRMTAEKHGRSADRELVEMVDGDLTDRERHAETLQRLRAHPVLEEARSESQRYAQDARDSLSPLPECEAKAALLNLCDAVVERTGELRLSVSQRRRSHSVDGEPQQQGLCGRRRRT